MLVLLRNVLYNQPSVGYRGYILFAAEIFRVTTQVDLALSDHFMIWCNLDFCKPVAQDQMLSFRRLHATDINKFSSDLEESALIRSPLNDDLSLAIDQFISTLQSIIDNHAPIIQRSVTLRPYVPWFMDEIKVAKRKRRQLER